MLHVNVGIIVSLMESDALELAGTLDMTLISTCKLQTRKIKESFRRRCRAVEYGSKGKFSCKLLPTNDVEVLKMLSYREGKPRLSEQTTTFLAIFFDGSYGNLEAD